MLVHPKASGHEAYGANFVAGTRKRSPHNPDEVEEVNDDFSEGRQRRNKRQPPKPKLAAETEASRFAAPDAARDNPWRASPATIAAQQAALALHSLLKDAAPDANKGSRLPSPICRSPPKARRSTIFSR